MPTPSGDVWPVVNVWLEAEQRWWQANDRWSLKDHRLRPSKWLKAAKCGDFRNPKKDNDICEQWISKMLILEWFLDSLVFDVFVGIKELEHLELHLWIWSISTQSAPLDQLCPQFWSATIPLSVRELAEAFLGRNCVPLSAIHVRFKQPKGNQVAKSDELKTWLDVVILLNSSEWMIWWCFFLGPRVYTLSKPTRNKLTLQDHVI